jgi:DNA polymerase V
VDSPFESELLDVSLDVRLCIREPGTYLVIVAGDSMTRAGIFDGDLLTVDKGADVKKGPGDNRGSESGADGEASRLCSGHAGFALRRGRSPSPLHHGRHEFTVWGVVTHSVRQHGIEP